MKFELTQEQTQEYNAWIQEHKCDAYAGAIGGKLSFVFTPTGLGMCQEVKCLCGETLDLTDWGHW